MSVLKDSNRGQSETFGSEYNSPPLLSALFKTFFILTVLSLAIYPIGKLLDLLNGGESSFLVMPFIMLFISPLMILNYIQYMVAAGLLILSTIELVKSRDARDRFKSWVALLLALILLGIWAMDSISAFMNPPDPNYETDYSTEEY